MLKGSSQDKFVVEVKGRQEPILVSMEETLQLNQPHLFSFDVKGDIVLEDSLIFSTKSYSEKAKLLEMTIKLAPLIKNLDF